MPASGFRDSCGDGGGVLIVTPTGPLSGCNSSASLLARLLTPLPSFDPPLALLVLLSVLPRGALTASPTSESALLPNLTPPPLPALPFPVPTSSKTPDGKDGMIRSSRFSWPSVQLPRVGVDARRPDGAAAEAEAEAEVGVEVRAEAEAEAAEFDGYACVTTPGSTLSFTGVWKRLPGVESGSGPECDCWGMYSPRPFPAIVGSGVEGHDGLPELCSDDEKLLSGGSVAGGGDRGARSRCGEGGIAGTSDFGDEAREECRRLGEPSPSLICTGKDATNLVLVSCAGSVSEVVVWRLALCTNNSSIATSANSSPAELLGGKDDGGIEGGLEGVAAPSWGFCTAENLALLRLLREGGDGGRVLVGDIGALPRSFHGSTQPPLLEDDGGGGHEIGVGATSRGRGLPAADDPVLSRLPGPAGSWRSCTISINSPGSGSTGTSI